MHLSQLKEKYQTLVRDLNNVEKTIISLKGELKWNPSVSSDQFREYDGAVNERDELEEELYELDLLIKKQHLINATYKDCDNILLFPIKHSLKHYKRVVN